MLGVKVLKNQNLRNLGILPDHPDINHCECPNLQKEGLTSGQLKLCISKCTKVQNPWCHNVVNTILHMCAFHRKMAEFIYGGWISATEWS